MTANSAAKLTIASVASPGLLWACSTSSLRDHLVSETCEHKPLLEQRHRQPLSPVRRRHCLGNAAAKHTRRPLSDCLCLCSGLGEREEVRVQMTVTENCL
jgi:hypothetical protein